ncbi:hypothetical protein ACFL3J_02125 [Candidatus Omnitrophota bacterium]
MNRIKKMDSPQRKKEDTFELLKNYLKRTIAHDLNLIYNEEEHFISSEQDDSWIFHATSK